MRRMLAGMVGIAATIVVTASLATAESVVYGEGGLSFSHDDDWVFSIGVSNHGSWLWQRGGSGEATLQTQSVSTRVVVDFAVDGPAEHDHILVIDDLSGSPTANLFVDALGGEVFPTFAGVTGEPLAFDFLGNDRLRAEILAPAEAGGAALIVHNLRTGESVATAAPDSWPDPFIGPIRLSFFTGFAGQIFVLRVEVAGDRVVPTTPSTWAGVKALFR